MKLYKTSDSPMSLYISILSIMFFEGRGPAISLFRRCVFALLSCVVFCPNFFGSEKLQIAFWVWAGVFLITDEVQMTHEKCKMKCGKPKWDKNVSSKFHSFFFVHLGIVLLTMVWREIVLRGNVTPLSHIYGI